MLEPADRQRFERLIMPHQDAAFNLARWLLRSRADAEDVTQDALVRALRPTRGRGCYRSCVTPATVGSRKTAGRT